MDNHFAWWYLSNQPLNVHRLTDDLITTSLHYSPKRRERFLHGRALLAELMFQLYGYEKLPRLAVAPSGRPCFVDPTLPDFSLGYAGSVIALMLGTNGKVGMDVEIIRARQGGFIHLQQQYITSGEKIWIDGQADRLEATTQLWAIRESVLKISGLGTSGLQTLRLLPGAGKLRSTVTPQVETISAIQGEIAWACSKSPSLGQLNYWLMDQEENQLVNITAEKQAELKESASYLRFTSNTPIQTA